MTGYTHRNNQIQDNLLVMPFPQEITEIGVTLPNWPPMRIGKQKNGA